MARDLLARLPSLRRSFMRACSFAADRMPVTVAAAVARTAGLAAWMVDARGRRTVARNLSGVVPTRDALDRAVLRSYTEFSLTLAEAAKLHHAPDAWMQPPRMRLVDPWKVFAKPPLAGPAILVSVHSHWDMLAAACNRLGLVGEVVSPALAYGDPALDRWLAGRRGRWGCRTVSVDRAPLAMLRALRDKRVLGMLVDRDYTGRGIPAAFLGRPTRLPSGPAALAVQTGAPVIPLFLGRAAPSRFLLLVGRPMLPDPALPRTAQVAELTGRIAAATSRLLAAAPAQWVAFHEVA